MRALLLGVLLVLLVLPALPALPPPPALAAGAAGPHVHVRIEGRHAQLWDGWVELPATFTFTGSYTGRLHTVPGNTPLGALWAAAQQAGMALDITDQFSDFVAWNVSGEFAWGATYWNYRVDWVQTNYGEQGQWLAWGAPKHPIVDGGEVLWYVELPLDSPLHLTDLGPVAGSGPCARAELVQTLALDEQHEPGRDWPRVVWAPVPLATLAGASDTPVVAGAGVAVASRSGPVWADEAALPASAGHSIRSERSWLPCGGA